MAFHSNLIVSNSSITANKNAYIGVAVDGKLELKNNSTMTVTENALVARDMLQSDFTEIILLQWMILVN